MLPESVRINMGDHTTQPLISRSGSNDQKADSMNGIYSRHWRLTDHLSNLRILIQSSLEGSTSKPSNHPIQSKPNHHWRVCPLLKAKLGLSLESLRLSRSSSSLKLCQSQVVPRRVTKLHQITNRSSESALAFYMYIYIYVYVLYI